MNRQIAIDSTVQLSTDHPLQKVTLNGVTNSLGNFLNAGILQNVEHSLYIVRAMPDKIVGWVDNSI